MKISNDVLVSLGYKRFETKDEMMKSLGNVFSTYWIYEDSDFPCWMKHVETIEVSCRDFAVMDRIGPEIQF